MAHPLPLLTGEIIEEYDYDNEKPYQSRLVLAWLRKRHLHVVASDNTDAVGNIVVTVCK
ncbi:MAG: DUF4258 domain-containing protein [Nitrospiria bacterium]